MKTETGMTGDGLKFVRLLSDRITTWDGENWSAEYCQEGQWVRYPNTLASDPTRGELFSEGRNVLANLKRRITR